MVNKLKVKNHLYSRIRSQRLNSLLIFASGHTYTQTYAKALQIGVSPRTARSYMRTLTNHLSKRKPIPIPIEQLERYKKNPYDSREVIIGAGSDILDKPVFSSKDDNTITID